MRRGFLRVSNINYFLLITMRHLSHSVFLSPPLRKQVVCCCSARGFMPEPHLSCQIIKEKLAFPSGTATAQLISVLYRDSAVDSSLRQRRGYRALNAEEDIVPDETDESNENTVVEYPEEQEQVMKNEAQGALIWSFVVSAALTVRKHTYAFQCVLMFISCRLISFLLYFLYLCSAHI